MPLSLSFQQKMLWAWTLARRLDKDWDWIAGSFKPESPPRFQRTMATGIYLLDGTPQPKKMNCWEAVLISGIFSGIYTRDDVINALKMRQHTPHNRLMNYVKTNACRVVQKDGAVPTNRNLLGCIMMFGNDGAHFALSLGGEILLNLDRSQKGTTTLTKLRNEGYQGETFWPLYMAHPPAPADLQ